MNASPEPSKALLSENTRWFQDEVLPAESALRAYLSRSLPSQADVDDVVQDSFVRILRAKGRTSILRPKPFLFAVARNLVRNWLHKKQKNLEVPITEVDGLTVITYDDGVAESVCREQELELLAKAIESLPNRCREVVLLRRIRGCSQKEIAEMLGISENTVESLAAKGVRRCAVYLEKHGVEGRNAK